MGLMIIIGHRSSKSTFGANNRPIFTTLSQPILPGNFSLFPQLSLSVRNLGPSWTILIEQQKHLSDPSLIQSMSLEWIFTVSCFSFVLIGSEWAGIYLRHNVKVSLNRQLSLPGAPSPNCQASTTDTTKVRSSQAHKTSWWAHRPTPTQGQLGRADETRRRCKRFPDVGRPYIRHMWGGGVRYGGDQLFVSTHCNTFLCSHLSNNKVYNFSGICTLSDFEAKI